MSAVQPDLFESQVAEQRAVIRSVDSDPRREHDRAVIDAAVRAVAARNGGTVSTNAIRRELTSRYGSGYVVSPQSIGPRLAQLTRDGVLEVIGRDINTDAAGRNAGKEQPLRRWVGET